MRKRTSHKEMYQTQNIKQSEAKFQQINLKNATLQKGVALAATGQGEAKKSQNPNTSQFDSLLQKSRA